MATTKMRRLSADDIQTDRQIVDAIRIMPDYVSVNPDYSLARLEELDTNLVSRQQAERRAEIDYDGKRDDTMEAALELHDAVLGAKAQVIAQFGPNSNAVASLGLKKKSEYKRRTKKTK